MNEQHLLVVNAARVQMPIRRFVPLIEPESSGAVAAFYADGAGNLARSFPFLASDFAPPPMTSLLELKRADLWVGGRSTSRMHFDNLDNVFAQLVGQKTFVLAPPDEGVPLVKGRRVVRQRRLGPAHLTHFITGTLACPRTRSPGGAGEGGRPRAVWPSPAGCARPCASTTTRGFFRESVGESRTRL